MAVVPKATLAHFEQKFCRAPDPWKTHSSQAERHKRIAIAHLLGAATHARVLELGCGNGSNSLRLARQALTLDACDGAHNALRRARAVLGETPGVTLHHLPLPGRFPANRYDAIVIAELLYYLPCATLAATMREIDRTLRPGGLLVLCHHHSQFADAVQKQAPLHDRFIGMSRHSWSIKRNARTALWSALSVRRSKGTPKAIAAGQYRL